MALHQSLCSKAHGAVVLRKTQSNRFIQSKWGISNWRVKQKYSKVSLIIIIYREKTGYFQKNTEESSEESSIAKEEFIFRNTEIFK